MEGVQTSSRRAWGLLLVIIGATMWGVSGTVAQYLFQHKSFNAEWLVVVRMLVSGLLLLAIASKQRNIFAIWKTKEERTSLLLFGVIGMLGVQYTYFAAIEAGNAATATVLQYTSPIFIIGYLAVQARKWPVKVEMISVALVITGTFFLATSGNFNELSITGWALFWGIGAAVTSAFYTLQPKRLLAKWSSIEVVGWGMVIGGVSFSFIHPPWHIAGEWSLLSLCAVLFVVIFGTLIVFYCYLESLKHISASEAIVLASAEPLSAAALSVLWLHVTFGWTEWLGTILIIATVFLLSQRKPEVTS
ncbi:EamA family transporter [Priestia megaterium]|uniref:EamA family transporter n=1 Tax=Priestia megaterium TaxID=1404 RepID=UPI000BEE5344|nr:EamA family transporter [Priestia megaterium]PEB63991.1 EamA family transporter [Priestia megaterium]